MRRKLRRNNKSVLNSDYATQTRLNTHLEWRMEWSNEQIKWLISNDSKLITQWPWINVYLWLDLMAVCLETWKFIINNTYKFCLSDRGLLRTFLFVVVVRVSEDESWTVRTILSFVDLGVTLYFSRIITLMQTNITLSTNFLFGSSVTSRRSEVFY